MTNGMRRCEECGAAMRQGFVIDGGTAYYCGETCLHKHYTPAQWAELYGDGEGDSYWTTWEDDADKCEGCGIVLEEDNANDREACPYPPDADDPCYYCPFCVPLDSEEDETEE